MGRLWPQTKELVKGCNQGQKHEDPAFCFGKADFRNHGCQDPFVSVVSWARSSFGITACLMADGQVLDVDCPPTGCAGEHGGC